MTVIVLICFVVVLLLMFSWFAILKHKQRCNVPGPFPLPVIGNAHLFIVKSTDFLNLLYNLSHKYGDAFLVYLMSRPNVIMSHPRYIEPIVSSSELISKGRAYEYLRPWLGNGLLTATGHRWKTHRRFLTPAFHFNILQNFVPIFSKNSRILNDKLDDLADGEPVSLFPIIALAALDNVTEAIMGLSMDSQKNSQSKYVQSIETLSQIISLRMQVAFFGEDLIFNRTEYKTKQDAAIKYLHDHTRNVIEARRSELKRMNITTLKQSNDLGIKNRHAFLDLLLLAEVDGQGIDEESIREEVDTFMFEGHDTTTSGICYNLYCISNNQMSKKKYWKSKKAFSAMIFNGILLMHLGKMKYLETVVKESLRIYPSVPLIERKITRDVEVGGLKLLQGTSVLMNIFQMQRNPELFKDPMEFRPERFEANSTEIKNPFSYIAFSAGPRNCIGQKFAMLEMKLTLSMILRRFKVLPANIEPQLCADLILRAKNGVYVKFLRR